MAVAMGYRVSFRCGGGLPMAVAIGHFLAAAASVVNRLSMSNWRVSLSYYFQSNNSPWAIFDKCEIYIWCVLFGIRGK